MLQSSHSIAEPLCPRREGGVHSSYPTIYPRTVPCALQLTIDAATFPRVAVLAARIEVGESQQLDATCEAMKTSPLGAQGLPGPALISFLAGASVFGPNFSKAIGGLEPRLFIGG